MSRARSEYRLSLTEVKAIPTDLVTRRILDSDRSALAALMLDAYRGTIDDEGETTDDAIEAVNEYFARMVHEHSLVVTEHDRVVAMALVVMVDHVHYVDPVAVAADHKRKRIGRGAVTMLLDSLAGAGVTEVGATITDGNVASEGLFLGLGFERRGPWA